MEKEIEEAAEKYINDDLELYESLVDGHISYNIGVDLLNKLFKAGAKWQASITINGKTKYLGLFISEYSAHLAYQNKLKEIL